MVTLVYSLDIQVVTQKYNDLPECAILKEKCIVKFSIQTKMRAPIMFYYQLNGFYQNYDQYMSSKNSEQLSGKILSVNDLSSCSPIIRNRDLGQNITSWNYQPLEGDSPANPCGLIAKTFFSGFIHNT